MRMLSPWQRFGDWGFLALRLVIGIIFVIHGLMKWKLWGMAPSDQMPVFMLTLMKTLSIAEPLGGLAVLAGFLTPFAAAGLGTVMLGAMYFKINVWHTGFVARQGTGWELDLMIFSGLVCLFLNGAGKISLDGLFPGPRAPR